MYITQRGIELKYNIIVYPFPFPAMIWRLQSFFLPSFLPSSFPPSFLLPPPEGSNSTADWQHGVSTPKKGKGNPGTDVNVEGAVVGCNTLLWWVIAIDYNPALGDQKRILYIFVSVSLSRLTWRLFFPPSFLVRSFLTSYSLPTPRRSNSTAYWQHSTEY